MKKTVLLIALLSVASFQAMTRKEYIAMRVKAEINFYTTMHEKMPDDAIKSTKRLAREDYDREYGQTQQNNKPRNAGSTEDQDESKN